MAFFNKFGGGSSRVYGFSKVGPPSAPTSLSVSSTTATTATIAFTAPLSNGGANITNYEFSTNGSTWTALSPADAITPVTVTGLSGNTSYTLYLRAVNAVGAGTASSGVSATTLADAPTGLSVSSTTTTTATIAFTAPGGTATITNYEYSTNGSTWTALSPADAITPVTITGLSSNTTYSIYLRAVNSAGSGTASSVLSVTTSFNATSASGGTQATYTSGPFQYRSHTFTSNGNFVVSSVGDSAGFDILVVGGGGGGGGTQLGRGYGDGGGGAGAFVTTTMNLPAATYSVVVGGAGGGYGGSGGTSTFGSAPASLITAGGGGGGGGCEYCFGGGGSGGTGSVGGSLGTGSTVTNGFAGRAGGGSASGQSNGTNTYRDGTAIYYCSTAGSSANGGNRPPGGVGASAGNDGQFGSGTCTNSPATTYGTGGVGGTPNCGTGTAGASGIVVVRYRIA